MMEMMIVGKLGQLHKSHLELRAMVDEIKTIPAMIVELSHAGDELKTEHRKLEQLLGKSIDLERKLESHSNNITDAQLAILGTLEGMIRKIGFYLLVSIGTNIVLVSLWFLKK